ncbi:DHH [Branchiostoma lanceolatum]|uniref:DHH protein n=1 Tax=Branchiostoma lanceolatum TaxID=7740 RepID=A0A8J9ZS96_BRALA|nr:DHH [Branchiostoma lanceolatum]
MAQGNRSHGSDFDDVVVRMEIEENHSVGTGAQGYYRPRIEPVYRNYYYSGDSGWDCFPDSTKVQLRDGRKIAMKDLKPGDWVKVVKPDGRIVYSKFIAMLHYEPDKKTTFLQIYVEGKNGPVCLTANHLIYATERYPQRNIERPVFAKDVEEGMFVFVDDEEGKKAVPAKVLEVREMETTGFCAPLTEQGSIMADGVAASCYANFDHETSHKAFGPLRLLYGVKAAFGGVGKEKGVVKVGIHWYAKALMKGNKMLFHVQPATAM